MAFFADINVSQCFATYARCDGIFDMHLTAHLAGNLPVKFFFKNRLTYGHESVSPFLAHPVELNTPVTR